MPKLSKRVVDAAETKDKDYVIWDNDLPGFGLRVFRTGKRSYLIQYRSLGRSRRYTIGLHGVWTPDAARQEAKVQLGRIAKGDNPAEERQLDHKAIAISGKYVAPGERTEGCYGALPNQWRRIFKGSTLHDITPHVLRHSYASIANDLGFTEATIAALVGNAKGSVTSKYIHTLDTALVMAADTVAGYIDGLLGRIKFTQTIYAVDRASRTAALSRFLEDAT